MNHLMLNFILCVTFAVITRTEQSNCPIQCKCDERALHCDRSGFDQLNQIKINTNFQTTFKILNLQNNRLIKIESFAFFKWSNVESLNLSNNQIEIVRKNGFSGLHQLQHLDLQYNHIKTLEKNCFENMYHLQQLNLNNNQLRTLSSTIGFETMLRPIYIQMHQNPIDCNCDINWLIEKIRSKLLRFIGFCENPNILRNLIIDGSIQPYLGKCNQSMMNQVSHRLDDISPTLLEAPQRIIYMNEGDRLELKCDAEGQPKPLINWINMVTAANISEGSNWVIPNVKSNDTGLYQCLASNPAGFAMKDFSIYVSSSEINRDNGPNVTLLRNQQENIMPKVIELPLTKKQLIQIDRMASEMIRQAFNRTISIQSKCGKNALARWCVKRQLTANVTKSTTELHKIIEMFKQSTSNKMDQVIRNEVISMAIRKLQQLAQKKSLRSAAIPYQLAPLFSEPVARLLKQQTECESLWSNTQLKSYSNLCRSVQCDHPYSYSQDGTCNNAVDAMNGAAGTPFIRLLAPHYDDGISAPRMRHLPNARTVTKLVLSKGLPRPHSWLSHMVMQWGQFVDHDLTHTLPAPALSPLLHNQPIDCAIECNPIDPCLSISLPAYDEHRNRWKNQSKLLKTSVEGDHCIEVIRSAAQCGSGLSAVGAGVLFQREQINQVTAYLDGSQVYGSSPLVGQALRDVRQPDRFAMSKFTQFPIKDTQFRFNSDCQSMHLESEFECFLTGDKRANEQVALTAMHLIWMREHNRIVDQIKSYLKQKKQLKWSSDRVFRVARRIVTAQMQIITYRDWLPLVIGQQMYDKVFASTPQRAVNQSESVSIANAFASAAMRFGHTLIQPHLLQLNSNYEPMATNETQFKLPLKDAFFASHHLNSGGTLDAILRGLQKQPLKSSKEGAFIVNPLVDELFSRSRHLPLDLSSINIQRGRDHGLPGYGHWYRYCNTGKSHRTFGDFERDKVFINAVVSRNLQTLYETPDHVDLFVGGVLERPLPGALVGPTFACILSNQFGRTRSADPFWFDLNGFLFSDQIIRHLQSNVSLARIICDNSHSIDRVHSNVFRIDQSLIDCRHIPQINVTLILDSVQHYFQRNNSKC